MNEIITDETIKEAGSINDLIELFNKQSNKNLRHMIDNVESGMRDYYYKNYIAPWNDCIEALINIRHRQL